MIVPVGVRTPWQIALALWLALSDTMLDFWGMELHLPVGWCTKQANACDVDSCTFEYKVPIYTWLSFSYKSHCTSANISNEESSSLSQVYGSVLSALLLVK